MKKKANISGVGFCHSIPYDNPTYSVKYGGDREKEFNQKKDAVNFYKKQRLPKALWVVSPISMLIESKHYAKA